MTQAAFGTRAGLRELAPGESLGLTRGQCAVCIPVYGGFRFFQDCVTSVLRHTPPDVTVVVADDCSEGPSILDYLRDLEHSGGLPADVAYVRQAGNVGFVQNVNDVFDAAAAADVILLNSDCAVAAGWYEGLRSAALAGSLVATASALSNNGSILSVPVRNHPASALPDSWTLDDAAAAVRSASPRLHPRIPCAIGHCVYVRRSALELVGHFDTAFSPGYGEEVDFSQRCIAVGLIHVAADDVFVLHHGGGSFGSLPDRDAIKLAHEDLLKQRYPYYHEAVATAASDQASPLAASLNAARCALTGISVTIDGSCFSHHFSGTQLACLEIIQRLSRQQDITLRVAVPASMEPYARDFLTRVPGLQTLRWDQVDSTTPRTDIVHRPFQVFSAADVAALRRLGERIVITQQDLIAYRNPTYFGSSAAWELFRSATRDALAASDLVTFYSADTAKDAVSEGIIDAGKAKVAYIGTDHSLGTSAGEPRAPEALNDLPSEESVILCLGNDFRHKNRLFALQIVDQLQRRHGWDGKLLLVGAAIPGSSSLREEGEYLSSHPALAAATRSVSAVDEDEKAWLLRRADLVLYPTVVEGFGLIPFEAAEAGTPCLFAPQASLAEILPSEASSIIPWDAAAAADAAAELLRDPSKARVQVELLREAGLRYRWSDTARELVAIYRQIMATAPQPAPARPAFTPVGEYLLGPDGLSEETQHLLSAIARRPFLSRPLLGLSTRSYRLARRYMKRRTSTEPAVAPSATVARIDSPITATTTPTAAFDDDTSQHGEIRALRALLKPGFPRYIVDVGAYDGITMSNSRPFVLDGWHAVLIEPHPTQFARLKSLYEGVTSVQCVDRACSDRPGILPLYMGSDGPESMMSTLCTDENEWFERMRSRKSVPVEVETLTAILERTGAPHDFSILLVDGEGMDCEILKGLDQTRFRPRVVVTEEYIWNAEKHRDKYRLLLDSGYTFYDKVGCNTIWIANEWVVASVGRPD